MAQEQNRRNTVNAAVGTLKQFSKQPEQVYQKRLLDQASGQGISIGQDLNAGALASALGILGSNINAEVQARNNRRQTLGEAEADRLFQVQSEEDIMKLQTLDVLGQSEKFDIDDNPYAIARFDNLRGQHLNTKFRNQYNTEVLPNQALPSTSQENIKNFEDFMSTQLDESGVDIKDKTAFDSGFFGTRPIDLLEADKVYRSKRQQDREAERNSIIAAQADELLVTSMALEPQELAGVLQDLQNSEMLTHMSVTERLKLGNVIGKKLAENGNIAQMDAWGETVLYFDKNTGDAVKVKDVIPVGSYREITNVYNAQHWDNKTREFLSNVATLPSAAIPDEFDKLKESDPEFYKAVAGKMKGIMDRAIKAEQDALKADFGAAIVSSNEQRLNNALNAKLEAHFGGMSIDSLGRGVTDNKYKGLNAKGEPKDFSITQEDWTQFLQEKFIEFSKLPPAEAAKKQLHTLSMPGAKDYLNDLKRTMSIQLGSLTAEGLRMDATGNYMLPENIQSYLNLYNSNPSEFMQAFSKNSSTPSAEVADLLTLARLQDTMSTLDAVKTFSAGQAVRNDKERFKLIQKETEEYYERDASTGFKVRNLGSDDKARLAYQDNPSLFDAVTTNFESERCINTPTKIAAELADKRVSDTFVSYAGIGIPRAFFNTVKSTNQELVSYAVLEDIRKSVAGEGGDPKDVNVWYERSTNTIRFNVPGKINNVVVFREVDFRDRADNYMKSIPEPKRVLLEDVTKKTVDINSSDFTDVNPSDVAYWENYVD